MIDKIKDAGYAILGVFIMIALMFIPALFLWGGIKLGTILSGLAGSLLSE